MTTVPLTHRHLKRIAARAAHDINNPLAGIKNSLLLIRDAIPPSHPHYRYVGAIEREIARITAATRSLTDALGADERETGV